MTEVLIFIHFWMNKLKDDNEKKLGKRPLVPIDTPNWLFQYQRANIEKENALAIKKFYRFTQGNCLYFHS